MFTFGTPLSYGILQGPFAETYGVSSVAMSGVFSGMLFTFFIGSGILGVVAARVPARVVLGCCAGVTALLAPAPYVVTSLAGLALVFALLGLALGTAFVLLASVVPRWFDRRRGAATGLIFVGNGLGLAVLPPVWQRALATAGVQEGFLLVLGVTAGAFALAAVVCRRPAWAGHTGASVREMLGWARGLAGRRSFQLLFVGMGLAFAWYQLLAAYAVDLFAARGMTAAAASTAFGLIGGVSIVSRIGGGYVADRIGSRRAFLGSLALAGVGIVFLFAGEWALLAVAVVLVGLGLGGCATLYIPLLMGIFDPEKDTAIVGIFNVAGGVGALAMPPLGTASVALTGSFDVAVGLTFGVVVVGFVATVLGTRVA
ncbi:hypothetical protein JCM17823_11340 [Halorubrum gandharaense]